MGKELFNQLLESVKEAGKINKGLKAPSRKFSYSPLDVKAIRNKLHYSQAKFTMLIGVSPRTMQNWEQGRRQPAGPAQVLLRVASINPKAVQKALMMG